jgi:hypothetical protein
MILLAASTAATFSAPAAVTSAVTMTAVSAGTAAGFRGGNAADVLDTAPQIFVIAALWSFQPQRFKLVFCKK